VSAIDTATFEFMQYISRYGKSYDTIEEFNTRMALFQKTNTFIKEWNSQPNQTSTVGHNFISDMTEEEKERTQRSFGGRRREIRGSSPLGSPW